ncbi:hypothetical protein TAC_0130 [Acinetobacter phage TAC1]|nr:hypothetical protein TAC_0130 [Acinetobacter phage TAC1]
MPICIGGPFHDKHANCGDYIYTIVGTTKLVEYRLRDYCYDDGSIKKIQLYQHVSLSDECIIQFLNEKFNLNPVEKKS